MKSPSDFGVYHHEEFREGQYETDLFLKSPNRKKISIVEAPTGSGKSANGAILGWNGKSVRVLTKTKSLQSQYEQYDFEVLFGVGNYDCALHPMFDAGSCVWQHNMFDCPVHDHCTYLIQREATKEHYRQSLSYQYFLAAKWVKDHHTDWLYCDEAHELSRIVTDYTTLEVTRSKLAKWETKTIWPYEFPIESQIFIKKQIVSWLFMLKRELSDTYLHHHQDALTSPRHAALCSLVENTERQVGIVIEGLDRNPESYYIDATKDYLKIVPLTAKFDFNRLFVDGWKHKLVLTSATIGNPNEFAYTLGIEEFDFREVPSNFPPADMPIYTPVDAPKMNHSAKEPKRRKQARIIERLIKACDPTWNALIHVSSKWQARDLAKRLSKRGFADRIWLAPEHLGTEARLIAWMEQLKKVPNTINISWWSHEGVDAGFCNINIVAKVPFAALDNIGQVKLDYDPKLYQWQTAILTMQACGRTRRGEPDHYGPHADKLVAIVDSNYKILSKYYSDHFKQCLTKM